MTSYCISTAARVNYSHPRSVICFVLDPKMDTRSKRRRDYDLKVDGWSDDKENEPVEKRKRLSLNKKKPAERYCLSLGGLRQYEKVTTTQQQAVCRVLSVNTNSTYDNEVSRMSLPFNFFSSTKLTFNFSFTSCTKHTYNSCSSTANEF